MNPIIQQSTKDYSRFVMHEINRSLINDGEYAPRKDLVNTMRRDGFWPTEPIKCVELPGGKLKIIDGHNRFNAARFLNLAIEYIAYPQHNEISPLMQATTQVAWTQKDKANAYAKQGSADYAEVLEFHESTKIPLGICFSLFFGDMAMSGNSSRLIGAGTYKVKDREYPYIVAAIVRSIESVGVKPKASLIGAVSRCIRANGFSVARMCERIERNAGLLKECRTIVEYMDLLETIYNFNRKGERYYLKAEADKAMRSRNAVKK